MGLTRARELAAQPPSAPRWTAIWDEAARLGPHELDTLDAALAGWPDALRVARATDVIEPREALRVARRLELAEGVIDRACIERVLATGLVDRATSLALFSLETTLDAVEVIAHAQRLPALAELQLACPELDAASKLLAGSTLPLRILTFEGGSATDDSVRALTAGPGLSQLVHLQYHDVAVGDDGLAILASSARWAPLVHLRISYAGVGSAGAISLAASPHLRHLESIDLRLTHIGADGIAALAPSGVCATLTELYVDEAELGARGVTALAHRWRGGPLRVLGLAHNRSSSILSPEWQVGPAATQALAEAGWTQHLVRLDMAGNAIGDAGARAIAASPMFPALRELDLSMNDIGDAGVEAILAHDLLARLTHLRLAHTELSAPTLDALFDACERNDVQLAL